MTDLSVLKNRSRLVAYPKGTVLDGAVMRVLFQGEAGVISGRPGEQRLVGRLRPGDFFGEAALFLQEDEPLAAVALTDIVVLPLAGEDAAAFFSEALFFCADIVEIAADQMGDVPAFKIAMLGDVIEAAIEIPFLFSKDFFNFSGTPDIEPALLAFGIGILGGIKTALR